MLEVEQMVARTLLVHRLKERRSPVVQTPEEHRSRAEQMEGERRCSVDLDRG